MNANAHGRIGLDLGGTKIAGILLGADGRVMAETRRPSPRNDYAATIHAIVAITAGLTHAAPGATVTSGIGIGIPGSVSPRTGLVQNANSTWLNGRPLFQDLKAALGRPVRLANDANCFALSETYDGAACGAKSVFGVILGTGAGGGIVINGALLDGPHGMAGEWGHTPLPWTTADWCGRRGCMETWVSGTGLTADHAQVNGLTVPGEAIVCQALAGDQACRSTLDRHADRLARGLSMIANILDPEVFVLGGSLSQLSYLYDVLPKLMARHLFTDHPAPVVRAPRWGDASGVRGAARLWG